MARAKKQTTSMDVEVVGLKPMLRQLSQTSKGMQNKVRDAATRIAETESREIVNAAYLEGDQAELAAQSVRPRRDRVPAIVAGGAKRLATRGKRKRRPAAGDVFFGSEFGGQARTTTQQFKRHLGTEGYWFWPTLREDSDEMQAEYLKVLDDVVSEWSASIDAAVADAESGS